MLIKCDGGAVFRIDDEGEDGRVSTCGTSCGVNDKRAPKPPAAKALIDSQAADQTGRQHTTARQAFGFFRRKVREREAAGGECVISGNRPRRVAGDKAVAHPPSNVLRCQFVQIAIKRRHATGEALAIVNCAEGFNREIARHYGSRIRSRRAAAARIKDGDGGGGLRIASANLR